jgi:NTP pyrophosphatase (non-canonical NTP hydrolase)
VKILKPSSLKEWQEMFQKIYGEKNERDYSPADLLLHVEEEAALIDEALRKEKIDDIPQPFARLIAWLIAFCNMVGIDLEKMVWEKYQGICPYCGREENCMCITYTDAQKPKEWYRNPKGKMPSTLNEWQRMFEKIYGKINKMMWLLQVWLHFHEELGELSRDFRLESLKIKEEIADVFAWIVAFANKMKVNLEEILWKQYPGRCDTCDKEKCVCPKV